MVRLFTWLSVFVFTMILTAGAGAYWLLRTDTVKARQDAVAAIAKGAAIAIAANIEQLNKTLDKMAGDPDVLTATAVGNPAMLDRAAAKLEKYLPGVMKIRLFLPDIGELDNNAPGIGFADLDMVRETLANNQLPSVQGEKTDRHLAIARRITVNGQTIGVMLASLNYDFINQSLSAAATQGIYMELKQGKAVLASAGGKPAGTENEANRINVANTDWALNYQQPSSSNRVDLVFAACVMILAFFALLACLSGYRRLSNMLSADLHHLMRAFKDLMTHSLQVGSYPFQLSEMSALFSNLMQFKRVLDHTDNSEVPMDDKNELNITVSDDEDFDSDLFFDDSAELNLR